MYLWYRAHLHGKGEARQSRPGTRPRDPRGDAGTIGVEDPLTPEEIAEADAVILAVDIKVEKGRFEGKPTLEIPTSLVVKAPKQVIQKVAESIGK